MAGSGGLRLLLQDEKGGFADATDKASAGRLVSDDLFGVWAADVEMDGDIDVVAGPAEGPPFVLRNNGDGTWRRIAAVHDVAAARAFAWADLDQDADPDALFLDAPGIPSRASRIVRRACFALAPALPGSRESSRPRSPTWMLTARLTSSRSTRVGPSAKRPGRVAAWIVEQMASWPGFTGRRSRSSPASRRRPRQQRRTGSDRCVAGTSRIWLANQSIASRRCP